MKKPYNPNKKEEKKQREMLRREARNERRNQKNPKRKLAREQVELVKQRLLKNKKKVVR